MPLTVRQIESAKPADKDYKLSDGQGLYLLIKKSGARYWNLKYRFAGKEKKLVIGVYPGISLALARQKRDEARKLIAEGKDPSYEKQASKHALRESIACTFCTLAEELFTHMACRWTAGYLADQRARFENHINPMLGKRPVADIRPLEILNALRVIEKNGKLEALRKTRQLCSQIFDYAIATGRATINPASTLSSVVLHPEKQQRRMLSEEQLGAFMYQMKVSGNFMSLVTQILVLTAVRTGELRLATWDEIDFTNALWVIPKERMKMRRPHVVPLSHQTQMLLKEIKIITAPRNSELVIPGVYRDNQPRGRGCINEFLQQVGWHTFTTAHGFRHTFSTILHDHDFSSAWIELQLAHVDKNIMRGTYNHAQYLDGRREMMQWYADYIDSLSEQA
ncbi:tyrosine-type recombinase/integrase [Escherichia coli]|uniref:tyrosine-type recombinase/integrase n=1 Tax=Escherichia coli TaxID=562 RepID=UPI000A1F8556|nr:integrase arm-type DNA-binding domain-containing protein [Escherichia coli]OSP28285.1 integrase [Escherichia coli]